MRVLICGAGIAGTALAWHLSRQGAEVTMVEKSTGQRSSGNPVDVRGEALQIVDAMGGGDRLRAAATRVRRLAAVDARGRLIARIPASAAAGGVDSIEVPRSSLVDVLLERMPPEVRIVMDESVAALQQHDDPALGGSGGAVDIEFDSGATGTFDAVVGADGQHSRVRSLVFGPERQFVRRLGMFVATVETPDQHLDPEQITMLNVPGRSFTLHPSSGRPGGAFIFHSDAARDADRREWDRSVVADAYADLGWRVPEFVDRFMAAQDVYFDAVTRIAIDTWSVGRVVLLGDAASSVSLFGDGSSSAVIGARRLAEAVAEHPAHLAAAFAAYEARHRPLVMSKQRAVGSVARLLVPRTAVGLASRNLLLRGVSAGTTLRRLVTGRRS